MSESEREREYNTYMYVHAYMCTQLIPVCCKGFLCRMLGGGRDSVDYATVHYVCTLIPVTALDHFLFSLLHSLYLSRRDCLHPKHTYCTHTVSH